MPRRSCKTCENPDHAGLNAAHRPLDFQARRKQAVTHDLAFREDAPGLLQQSVGLLVQLRAVELGAARRVLLVCRLEFRRKPP